MSEGIEIQLKCGGHGSRDQGMCLMEAVAFIASEPHSDHPMCADPVLGAFGRAVNDFMTDDERQLLVPIVPLLVGTAGDYVLSLRRAMLICDGAVRQILPIAMEKVGLQDVAKTLRGLSPVVDEASASAARSAARSAASAARSAARSAAYSVAYSAADSAASAARSAASVANSAARSAASAARSAADSAAYAANSAAYSVASAAYAARSAARKPVIDALISIFKAAIEVK